MDVPIDAFIQSFLGIDVGDHFYSRAEMVVLGIHSHWLNGIDFMGLKYQGKVTAADISVETFFKKKIPHEEYNRWCWARARFYIDPM
jgi:hypothetical protein